MGTDGHGPSAVRRALRFALTRILPVVAALVGGALVWALWPQSAAGDVAGLDGVAGRYDATIVRDTYGVPHVFGATDADGAYGLAFAHAEDDFLTIQQSLLAARGRLATVYGLDAAPNDYLVGLLRIADTVTTGYPRLSGATRALVEAYADGLNHYAALHPADALPGLFPVDGADVVATAVHKSPLFFGLDQTLVELFDDGPLALTRHDPSGRGPEPDAPTALGLDLRAGSNVLAVAPSRSADGATHLVSNSHQPWTGPVAWYEASVQSEEGWHATGALFPGVPTIVHGHNERLGWSFTVNHADLVDVYELEIDPDDPDRYRVDGEWLELERREVPITVRLLGRARWTVTREALWSIYGPTVRRDDGTFAVRYAGMGTVGIYEQLHRMNRATTFEGWRSALASQDGLPTFNLGYADATGRIAYVYNALLPDRAPGFDWAGIVPGNTRETLWTEYLPFDALPHVVDPPAGFVQNANSTPFTATVGTGAPDPDAFPESTTGIERYETNRSLRLLELLAGPEPVDVEAIKFDHRYAERSDLARFRDRLVALAPGGGPDERLALDLLASWDLATDVGSRGAAVAIVTLVVLVEREEPGIEPSRLTTSRVDDDTLEAAFREAVAWLVRHHGTVDVGWGDVNRLVRGETNLPLAGAPDVLRAVYGRRGDDGVLVAEGGDSYVLLAEWDAEGAVTSRSIHPFGSATLDAASVHHDDQSPLFAREELKPVWFTEADIRANQAEAYRPGERDR